MRLFERFRFTVVNNLMHESDRSGRAVVTRKIMKGL